MFCPRCGGAFWTQTGPDSFQCKTEVLQAVVPAGAHGNPMPRPVYGLCHFLFGRDEAEHAQRVRSSDALRDAEQRRLSDQAAAKRAAEDAARAAVRDDHWARVTTAVRILLEAGAPGQEQRFLTYGTKAWSWRHFDLVNTTKRRPIQPAWPVGRFAVKVHSPVTALDQEGSYNWFDRGIQALVIREDGALRPWESDRTRVKLKDPDDVARVADALEQTASACGLLRLSPSTAGPRETGAARVRNRNDVNGRQPRPAGDVLTCEACGAQNHRDRKNCFECRTDLASPG